MSYAIRTKYINLNSGAIVEIVHALGNYRIGHGSSTLVQEVCQSEFFHIRAIGLKADFYLAHSCSPTDLVRIARVLLRSPELSDKQCGKNILLAASDAGYSKATIMLGATMHLSQGERESVLAHLRKLAKDKNIDALTLLGRMYENKGLVGEATKLYEAATKLIEAEKSAKPAEPANPTPMARDPDWVAMPHAATLLGELHLNKLGDWQTGEQYFKTAALEGDDPYAYWVLADLDHQEQGKYTAKWLEYTTKAAASGYGPAAFALGQFYYKPIEELKNEDADEECLRNRSELESVPFYSRKPSDRGVTIALEWYSIAFSTGHLDAGARLSRHYNKNGQYLKWYDILQKIHSAPKEVKKMYPGAVKYCDIEFNDFRKHYRLVLKNSGAIEDVVRKSEEQ
jgi:TPR repeat protein